MIGNRIKLARNKNGLSLRALADALGNKVSAQAIGKYERGEMDPSSSMLIALSKTLNVSLDYLLDSQKLALTNVDFRTKANTTAKDRARVQTEVIEWVERYIQIEEILDLDGAKWNMPFAKLQKIKTIEDAEKVANEVREVWNLGGDPIPNMTELLEEKRLKVLIVDLPERVSGFTCLVGRQGHKADIPVIVVNKIFTLERRRLTLAHELAHRVIDPGNMSEKDEEKAANRFASAFLMPAEHINREVGKHRKALGYRELMDLKRIYRVSGAALLVRLRDLGIISDNILVYAFQTLARGWRTCEPEPLESENILMEKPKRFERLCYRALAENLISLVKGAELLRCSVDDVKKGLKGPEQYYADHY